MFYTLLLRESFFTPRSNRNRWKFQIDVVSFSAVAAINYFFTSDNSRRYGLFRGDPLPSSTLSLIHANIKFPRAFFPMHLEYFAPSSNSVGVCSHSNSNFQLPWKRKSRSIPRDFSRINRNRKECRTWTFVCIVALSSRKSGTRPCGP